MRRAHCGCCGNKVSFQKTKLILHLTVLFSPPSTDALMVDLIREFLEFYSLDYTWSVFSSEANVNPPTKNWKALAEASGLSTSATREAPLLAQILTRFLSGNVAASGRVPEVSPASADSSSRSSAATELFAATSVTGSFPPATAAASDAKAPQQPTMSSTSPTSLTGSFPPTTAGPSVDGGDTSYTESDAAEPSATGSKQEPISIYGSVESGLAAVARATKQAGPSEAEPQVSKSLDTPEIAPVSVRQTEPEVDANRTFNASNVYEDEFDDQSTFVQQPESTEQPVTSASTHIASQLTANLASAATKPAVAADTSEVIEDVIEDDIEVELEDGDEAPQEVAKYTAPPTVLAAQSDGVADTPSVEHAADTNKSATSVLEESVEPSQSQDSHFSQFETYSEDETFTGEVEADKLVDLVPEDDMEENYAEDSYGLGDSAFRY